MIKSVVLGLVVFLSSFFEGVQCLRSTMFVQNLIERFIKINSQLANFQLNISRLRKVNVNTYTTMTLCTRIARQWTISSNAYREARHTRLSRGKLYWYCDGAKSVIYNLTFSGKSARSPGPTLPQREFSVSDTAAIRDTFPENKMVDRASLKWWISMDSKGTWRQTQKF